VKLNTLLQHQTVTASRTSTTRTRPSRLSESSVDDATCTWNGYYHGDNFADDQSDGSSSLPTATRSNSDASSLQSAWRESRRRRSDTDTSCVIDRPHRDLIDRPHTDSTQVLVDSSNITEQTTQATVPSVDHTAPHTIDTFAIDTCSPSQIYHHRWMPANQASPDTMDIGTTDQHRFDAVSQTLCTSTIDRRIIEVSVSPLRSEQRTESSVTSCDDVTTNSSIIENVSSADTCHVDSPGHLSPADDLSQGNILSGICLLTVMKNRNNSYFF